MNFNGRIAPLRKMKELSFTLRFDVKLIEYRLFLENGYLRYLCTKG